MDILGNISAIKKLDKANVLDSIAMFADQCSQAWEESANISFPKSYKQIKNIIVCGMGGSRFTPLTIKYLFKDKISLPYEIVDGYTLPAYANNHSLVILSSYSGTTEEVISCAHDAIKKNTLISVVTQGGELKKICQQENATGYFFKPKHNPSNQPRVGVGYTLIGHLGILKALQIVDIKDSQIKKAIDHLRKVSHAYSVNIPLSKNPAKKLSQKLIDTHPFIITAQHLKGFGNGFANQINETAKMISDFRYISELNHHLMEGLKRPNSLHKNAVFLFISSDLYSQSIKKRFQITKEVVSKQNISTLSIKFSGQSKLSQVLQAFSFSGYVTMYMAIIYKTDPAKIPWVDYFKSKLAS